MKHARRPVHHRTGRPLRRTARPRIDACLFHRCDLHADVPQLNGNEWGSECGGCLAAEVAALYAEHLGVLQTLSERLMYGAMLRQRLERARTRLNLLSPGAGEDLETP